MSTLPCGKGIKYTKEEAEAASGIMNIKWLADFELVFNSVMALSKKYLPQYQ